MITTEIRRAILIYTDNSPFISVSQFSKMMRIGRDSARTMLAGLEYIQNGNRKDYFVDDVARMLNEHKTI